MKLWNNVIFKFGVLLATVIVLSVVELALHYRTTVSLKNTTISLSLAKTSIENLLEADRDLYQTNLAVLTSIERISANSKNSLDSLRYAAYGNIQQIDGRYRNFNNNYIYKTNPQLQYWRDIFNPNYAGLKIHTDSIYFLLDKGYTDSARMVYEKIYLSHFYLARNAIDKLADIFYAESDTYMANINRFNKSLNIRSFTIYFLLIVIFLIVSVFSVKSIARRTRKINDLNDKLLRKNEEVCQANHKLTESYSNLEVLNEELLTSNEEFKTLNEVLEEQKKQLEKTLEQLKKTQIQLIQAEKNSAFGIIVAGLAHEINNPLNFITSGVAALEKHYKYLLDIEHQIKICENKDQFSKIKETTEEQSKLFSKNKYEKLITGILDGSKRITDISQKISQHHQGKELFEVSDLNKLIDFCIDLELETPGKSIAFVKKYGKVPQITCNMKNLCQVVNIITRNAIDSIEKTGSITFATGSNDDEIYISISDSGTGIDEKIMNKIFDPFFTTKPVGKGTGLGLYIAYDMIKKAGGNIIVDTETGKGSTFTIFLPKNMNPGAASGIINNNYTF